MTDESIFIPDTIEEINANALNGSSHLTFYYFGSEDEWNTLANGLNLSDFTVYCRRINGYGTSWFFGGEWSLFMYEIYEVIGYPAPPEQKLGTIIDISQSEYLSFINNDSLNDIQSIKMRLENYNDHSLENERTYLRGTAEYDERIEWLFVNEHWINTMTTLGYSLAFKKEVDGYDTLVKFYVFAEKDDEMQYYELSVDGFVKYHTDNAAYHWYWDYTRD